MMKKRIIFCLFLFLGNFFFNGCEQNTKNLLYPIPTLIVEDGLEKGFDLSVYKQDLAGQMTVFNHPNLSVRFLKDSDSLYILSNPVSLRQEKLKGTISGIPFELLIRVKPMVKHTFKYYPTTPNETVVVMGGFNDWSRTELKMDFKNGCFEKEVILKPQKHEYKFVVDGQEVIDRANPDSMSNNIGGWNSILDLTQFRESSGGKIIKYSESGREFVFKYLPPKDGEIPIMYNVFMNNIPLHNDVVDFKNDGGILVKKSGLKNGILRITGIDSKGRIIPENHTRIENGNAIHPKLNKGNWHFSILYSVVVDRFLDGDSGNTKKVLEDNLHKLANWHGGDLAGIIQKLENGYFTDLGISSLWLSPLQVQPDGAFTEWIPPNRMFTGYHGYWPIESRQVDPRYGTQEELKQLIDLAHGQGIKVILDFVSNHTHEKHPYYLKNREWFGSVDLPNGSKNIRQWGGDTRLTTWFDTFLPSYDFVQSPEAIDRVTDDALWWLETFNLDGFRQDAVKHVPHAFWKTLTRKMKTNFPEKSLYQIGESFGSDALIKSYVNPSELSSQFNFSIYFNARGLFKADNAQYNPLMQIILDNNDFFGPVHLMGNITSSHDQVRFASFADKQMAFSDNGTERAFRNPPSPIQYKSTYLKMANFHAFNLSLPGVPVLYYGDEIALMGAGDPDNRRPMKFDLNPEEQELKNKIGHLNNLRATYPSLSVGDFVPLQSDGPVMVYLKIYFDEVILVVFNQNQESTVHRLNLPMKTKKWVSLINHKEVLTDNFDLRLELSSYSHDFFLLKEK